MPKTIKFQGLNILIENPAGSTRSGISPEGKPWSVVMSNDYGEILGTKGADGDPVDVFIGPNKYAKFAYIITQVKQNGSFDENKVFLGFNDAMEAKQAFFKNYTNGYHFYGDLQVLTMEAFKKKLLETKEHPTLIRAGGTFKIGDPVTVDGMRGRGVVIGVKGSRITVRFLNNEYISRDSMYVHHMSEGNYKSKYSSLHAGGPGSGRHKLDLTKWKMPYQSKLDKELYNIELAHLHVNDLKTHSSETRLLSDRDDRKTINKMIEKMKSGYRFTPIDVVKMRNGKYDITDGNHRYLAWKLLGNKHIPVQIITNKVNAAQILSSIENEGIPEEAGRGSDKWIEKVGTQFCIRTNGVDNNLGCWPSREKAEAVMAGKSFIEPDLPKNLLAGKVIRQSPAEFKRAERRAGIKPYVKAGGPGSGRKPMYHGTSEANALKILKSGFKPNSFFTATSDKAKQWGLQKVYQDSINKYDHLAYSAKRTRLVGQLENKTNHAIIYMKPDAPINYSATSWQKSSGLIPATSVKASIPPQHIDKVEIYSPRGSTPLRVLRPTIQAGGPGSGRKPKYAKGLNQWKSMDKEREAARKDPKQMKIRDWLGPSKGIAKVGPISNAIQKLAEEKQLKAMEHFNIKSPFKVATQHGTKPAASSINKVGMKRPNSPMKNGKGSGHRLPNPTLQANDWGEPNAGAYQHAHLDSNMFFHPPSARDKTPVPTDDPQEKNDKWLDVTKRNSKGTKDQRDKLLKRSTPGGTPPLVPVRTTLISPTLNAYLPMAASAVHAGRVRRRSGGGMYRAYGAASV